VAEIFGGSRSTSIEGSAKADQSTLIRSFLDPELFGLRHVAASFSGIAHRAQADDLKKN